MSSRTRLPFPDLFPLFFRRVWLALSNLSLAHVAACTGLRISELLALKWADIQFDAQEIHPVRAIVDNHVGELKSEASGKAVPMDIALSDALIDWRGSCPYNQDTDFVFGSPEKKGKQPLWPDTLLHKVLKPAAVRAGITKRIGWHSFKHTYATLLVESGANVKDTQDLLRHEMPRRRWIFTRSQFRQVGARLNGR